MTRKGIARLAEATRKRDFVLMVGLLVQILMAMLSQSMDQLRLALVPVGVLTALILGRNMWISWRQAKALENSVKLDDLSSDYYGRITTVISAFDTLRVPTKDGRPSPVITLVQHLPRVKMVRLVVSPDEPGKSSAKERVAELRTWLQDNFPKRDLDVETLHVRVPVDAHDADVSERLAHEFSALRQRGVCIDITAGNKTMSITMMRAAEDAGMPVTYALQSLKGPTDTAFRGITVLSDPEGWLTSDAEADA